MSQNLKSIEFPAGRFIYDALTKKVTPDPSKGKIQVFHSNENEKHFKWINQMTGAEDLDLYVFEGDAKFGKVVKSKDRVYLLSFNSNDDKFFFWLQDPNTLNDETNCKTVNEIINFVQEEEENENENMEEEEEKSQPVQPSQQDLIAKFANQIQATFKKMGGGGAVEHEKETPSLTEVLKSEYLNGIVEDKEFQEALIPLLPEGRQDLDELKETLKSPQFLQALDGLDRAVNNESGASVLASLGLDPSFFYQNYDGSDSLYKGLNKLMKK